MHPDLRDPSNTVENSSLSLEFGQFILLYSSLPCFIRDADCIEEAQTLTAERRSPTESRWNVGSVCTN